MLAVGRHQPLDLTTELLQRLGGGSGVRVGDVDEDTVVDLDGSGAAAECEAEARLRKLCENCFVEQTGIVIRGGSR